MSTASASRPHLGWWLAIVPAMALLSAIAFVGPVGAWWQERVAHVLSPPVLRWIAALAWLAHLGEALYACHLARRLGEPVVAWTAQTFLLGFPSLRLLLARRR